MGLVFGPRARIVWVVALALIVFGYVRTATRAGEFTTLTPRFDGACLQLPGLVGAEDLVFDPVLGAAWTAGYDRRAARAGTGDAGGYIKTITFPGFDVAASGEAGADAARGQPQVSGDLSPAGAGDLRPHGIDLHIDAAGVRRLFVIDHAVTGDALLIFRVSGSDLILEERLTDPLLVNANDVVAIDARSAYVTLDKASPTGSLGELVEGVLDRRNGKVLSVSAEGVTLRARDLAYANGVQLIEDGRGLVVAETLGRSLAIFDRDPATNVLAFRERVFLGTGVDNITTAPDGRLFVAAHPKLLTFTGHARDPRKAAPSQVLMVDLAAKEVDQLFLDEGRLASGSATALVDPAARRMLIGTVYEPFVLACELPPVWRHSEAYPAARPQQR